MKHMNNDGLTTNPHHVSAVDAGRQFGYTNDYVSRLAREKKVLASRVGRQWYVDVESLQLFIKQTEEVKKKNSERLREERKKERILLADGVAVELLTLAPSRVVTLAKAGAVLCVSVLMGGLIFVNAENISSGTSWSAAVFPALRQIALRVYGLGEDPEKLMPQSSGAAAYMGASIATEKRESREGIVILPSEEVEGGMSDAEIRDSFSDEVGITRDEDNRSGIITPVFKDREAEGYRFLLVPIHTP